MTQKQAAFCFFETFGAAGNRDGDDKYLGRVRGAADSLSLSFIQTYLRGRFFVPTYLHSINDKKKGY